MSGDPRAKGGWRRCQTGCNRRGLDRWVIFACWCCDFSETACPQIADLYSSVICPLKKKQPDIVCSYFESLSCEFYCRRRIFPAVFLEDLQLSVLIRLKHFLCLRKRGLFSVHLHGNQGRIMGHLFKIIQMCLLLLLCDCDFECLKKYYAGRTRESHSQPTHTSLLLFLSV